MTEGKELICNKVLYTDDQYEELHGNFQTSALIMPVQMLKKHENALHPREQSKTGHICVDPTKLSSFIKALPVMCSIAR